MINNCLRLSERCCKLLNTTDCLPEFTALLRCTSRCPQICEHPPETITELFTTNAFHEISITENSSLLTRPGMAETTYISPLCYKIPNWNAPRVFPRHNNCHFLAPHCCMLLPGEHCTALSSLMNHYLSCLGLCTNINIFSQLSTPKAGLRTIFTD